MKESKNIALSRTIVSVIVMFIWNMWLKEKMPELEGSLPSIVDWGVNLVSLAGVVYGRIDAKKVLTVLPK